MKKFFLILIFLFLAGFDNSFSENNLVNLNSTVKVIKIDLNSHKEELVFTFYPNDFKEIIIIQYLPMGDHTFFTRAILNNEKSKEFKRFIKENQASWPNVFDIKVLLNDEEIDSERVYDVVGYLPLGHSAKKEVLIEKALKLSNHPKFEDWRERIKKAQKKAGREWEAEQLGLFPMWISLLAACVLIYSLYKMKLYEKTINWSKSINIISKIEILLIFPKSYLIISHFFNFLSCFFIIFIFLVGFLTLKLNKIGRIMNIFLAFIMFISSIPLFIDPTSSNLLSSIGRGMASFLDPTYGFFPFSIDFLFVRILPLLSIFLIVFFNKTEVKKLFK